MSARLFLLQRLSALVLAPLVLIHLGLILYAVGDGLSAGEILGRAEIAEHVWDDAYDPMSNVIDVYIQRLRRKLDVGSAESVISTRRGEGYALVCPVDRSRKPTS